MATPLTAATSAGTSAWTSPSSRTGWRASRSRRRHSRAAATQNAGDRVGQRVIHLAGALIWAPARWFPATDSPALAGITGLSSSARMIPAPWRRLRQTQSKLRGHQRNVCAAQQVREPLRVGDRLISVAVVYTRLGAVLNRGNAGRRRWRRQQAGQ